MPRRDRLRRRLQPTALGVVGLAATATALALVGGPLGLATGGAVFLLGLVVPAPVAVALGQAGLLVVLPAPTLSQVVVVEGALFIVLLGPVMRASPIRLGGLAAVLAALLGGATWLGVARLGGLVTAALLVGGVGFAGYLGHRYERVVLGLAGGESR